MSIQPLGVGAGIDAQNPWPGLSAFDEAAQCFFRGRDDESAELLRLVGQAPLTVLFGKSGLGKTSLVQAGLFPLLRQENILPAYVRLDVRDRSAPLIQQAASALQDEINEHNVDAAAPNADESLWEHLHGRDVRWWSPKNKPLTPLFVFDQFEEAFTLGAENADAIERLRLDLADLIENRLPFGLAQRIEDGDLAEQLDLRGQRYKVLLSFREDFLPEVEGWKGELPSLMRNRFRLLPMSADRALQVVSGNTPTGRIHELMNDDTAQEIVRFVATVQTVDEKTAQGKRSRKAADLPWEKLEIEPALLSLVCAGLNERRKARAQATIDATLLKETGSTIIDDFYQRCLANVPEQTQRFIEDDLITEGGFRNSYPLQDALDQGALTEPLLRELVDLRLLRIDHQLGAERVELIHDRLTSVVRAHRDQERERLRIRQQRRRIAALGSVAAVLLLVAAAFGVLFLQARNLRLSSLVQALAGQASRQPENHRQDESSALLARQAYLFNQRIPDQVVNQATVNAALREVLGFPYFSSILSGHTDRVWSVAFSPDGHTMASGSLDGTVRVWNLLQPGTKPIVLTGHENWVTSVAFGPDGQMLASGGDDKTLRLWDLRQPRAKPIIFDSKDWIWSVAFSSDGHTIASGSQDQTVSLWDLRQPSAEPTVLYGHEDLVTSLAFSLDGQMLASGSGDKTVQVWDLREPRAKPTNFRQKDAVSSVAFSPDGHTIASGSKDTTVSLWDLRQPNTPPTVLNGHEGSVRSVAFSIDGQMLASSGDDKTVRLWDLRQPGAKPTVLTGHLEAVSSVAFSSDSQTLASGSKDKTVRLWDLVQPSAKPTILTQNDDVSSVAFSPDGNMLASGSTSNRWTEHNILLWNLRQPSAKPIVFFIPDSVGISSMAFSSDGQMLAFSDNGKAQVHLWNLSQPDNKPTIINHASGNSLALSLDGHTLALGGYKKIQIWDLRQLETKPLILEGHENYVTSVAFSLDGYILASGSADNTVRLWNLRQPNAAPLILRGHEQGVVSVAFSSDGHTIASGSKDKTVRLWDLRQPYADPIILSGHEDEVRSVAFSPDGFTLASSSNDQTVRLWNLRQLDAVPTILRAVLRSPKDGFSSVAFSSNGQSLASGGDDGTIRIWNVRSETLADIVCKKVRRNLTPDEWRRFIGIGIPYERTCNNLPDVLETNNNTKPRATMAPITVSPIQMFPANKSVFRHFPRTVTLRWSKVAGATSYSVEYEMCSSSGCTDRSYGGAGLASNLQSNSYTYDFVGAQPGRWRVWAVDAAGHESPKSEWWEFKFTR